MLSISILSVIPPRIMGLMIDIMAEQSLTPQLLILGVSAFVFIALMMYALRYIWRIFIFGTSFRLENQMRNTIFKTTLCSIKKIPVTIDQ